MDHKVGTKQVSKVTGLSPDVIRKYCTFFDIEVERKQLPDGKQGHRLYSQENIKDLISIKELVGKGISWEHIKAARDGDEEIFIPAEKESKEHRSKLESKMDEMLERQKEQSENQNEFNRALLERLTEMGKQLQLQKQRGDDLERKNEELEKKVLQIDHKPNNETENESKNAEVEVVEKKKSFLARLFG